MIFTWHFQTIATSSVYVLPLLIAFPEFNGLFKNLVNHVAISLGTFSITSNIGLSSCSGVMFAWQPFSVVFELGLAYLFPLLPLETPQQHLNHLRFLVLKSANTHPLHMVPSHPCMHDIP